MFKQFTLKSIPFFPLLMLLLISACQKEDGINTLNSELPITVRTICNQVNYTAPATVNVGDVFNISALISCGRVALERGYIVVGLDTVYNGLTCSTPGLLWKEVVQNKCYTIDLSYNTSLNLVGTYAYRTRHNMNDGNCDGLGGSNTSGNCTGFNGNQFCCFQIEAVSACENSLTAEVNCDTDEDGCNRHVTFTFTAEDPGPIVIQGGLTAFTTICSATATGGLVLNPTHPSAGGPSNVTRWEGEVLGDCVEYTVTIDWVSTNNNALITGEWTAKRDGMTLASIAPLTCPE